ncbi:MAG: CBS domain-containing protein [Candidatus Methanoperedens sp.]|nr:CBS domain-containing protein [Candidatus Methanoperedens sp.]
MNNKLLKDIMARGAMTRGVITASINDKCKHIAKLLSEKDISGVCIIGDDGKAVGVISEMDIIKVIGMENWENMRAESIMTSNIEKVEPNTTLIDAAKIMRSRHVHRLLILSESGVGISQKPIGILSISDIIREAAKD